MGWVVGQYGCSYIWCEWHTYHDGLSGGAVRLQLILWCERHTYHDGLGGGAVRLQLILWCERHTYHDGLSGGTVRLQLILLGELDGRVLQKAGRATEVVAGVAVKVAAQTLHLKTEASLSL